MSIVAVHGPHTMGDENDQANDPLAFAQTAMEVGVAFNATTTSTGTAAQAILATATGEAFVPTRVTGY